MDEQRIVLVRRSLTSLHQQLRSVGDALAKLQATCTAVRRSIISARIEATPVLDEAKTLFARRDQIDAQRLVLDAFSDHFLLSDDELTTLTTGTDALTDQFFVALAKAKKIHRDSQILLGFESQRLGLEILAETSNHLEAAYQKLYRCIQRDFKSLDLENPHMNTSIRKALRVLAERRSLFESCLDAFAEARQMTLTESFHAALSGSGQDRSGPKPIELGAHEPLRYIGDMLAWVHSATVSEREALQTLFIAEGTDMARGMQQGLESEPWLRSANDEEAFDGRKALEKIVSRHLEGVAQLLRQRIEQVIRTHDDPVLTYKILNLVQFYKNIFMRLLNVTSLIEILNTLSEAAIAQFRTIKQYQVLTLAGDEHLVRHDLAPPPFLEASLDELHALLENYGTSMPAPGSEDAGLEIIISCALDPFLNHCETMASIQSPPTDGIFAINCLLAAKKRLSEFPYAQHKIVDLDDAIEEHGTRLSEYQHRFLLRNSGLGALVAALSDFAETQRDIGDLPSLRICSPESLSEISQELDNFLPSAIMDASQNVRLLRSPVLSRQVTDEAARKFCADFEMVEELMTEADVARFVEGDANGEHAPTRRLKELFPRTGEEIRILLS